MWTGGSHGKDGMSHSVLFCMLLWLCMSFLLGFIYSGCTWRLPLPSMGVHSSKILKYNFLEEVAKLEKKGRMDKKEGDPARPSQSCYPLLQNILSTFSSIRVSYQLSL